MTGDPTILDFIQAGGTPLLALVLIALYKLDRRILKIETKLEIDKP